MSEIKGIYAASVSILDKNLAYKCICSEEKLEKQIEILFCSGIILDHFRHRKEIVRDRTFKIL